MGERISRPPLKRESKVEFWRFVPYACDATRLGDNISLSSNYADEDSCVQYTPNLKMHYMYLLVRTNNPCSFVSLTVSGRENYSPPVVA
jgi:hypothetical protein